MVMPMIDTTKVLSKGQITIPQDIRERMKIKIGDRMTLICENDQIIMMSSTMFALKEFQKSMAGEAEKAGLYSDDDVVELIMQERYGDEM